MSPPPPPRFSVGKNEQPLFASGFRALFKAICLHLPHCSGQPYTVLWHNSQMHSTTAHWCLLPCVPSQHVCWLLARTATRYAATKHIMQLAGHCDGAGCQWHLVHRIMGASCMHGPCCVFCLQRQLRTYATCCGLAMPWACRCAEATTRAG
jgi:hypothetical protein